MDKAPENVTEQPEATDAGTPKFRVVERDDLDAHLAGIEANLRRLYGDEAYDGKPASKPASDSGDVRYRWRYFAPGSQGEDYPEEPTFVVVEDTDEPEEYSGFQDFAYDDFGLVDVMAFTYEPEEGLGAVEDVLVKLLADSRMVEDQTVQL